MIRLVAAPGSQSPVGSDDDEDEKISDDEEKEEKIPLPTNKFLTPTTFLPTPNLISTNNTKSDDSTSKRFCFFVLHIIIITLL